MRLIAHRGLVNNELKENTIEAFKAAIQSDKYIGFELDIRQTKDKEFVVYHDLLFKGRLISDIFYKELKSDNIPKLVDVLKLNTNKIIMIEIKDVKMDLTSLIKILNKFKQRDIYISSFNNKVLKEIKALDKKIKVGSLNYILNSEEDYKDYDFICIINYFLTDDLVKYFQKLNIEVFSYGIRNLQNIKNSKVIYIVDDEITN